MSAATARLPGRFPAGTKFVVEGQNTAGGMRIVRRYLVYPDGRQVDLLAGAPRVFACAQGHATGTARGRRAVLQTENRTAIQ
jgi:hypothetical protein